MRFQVPQNLDIKDTIILGLGFKEAIYLGGAGGITIFSYLFLGGILGVVFIGFPFVAFALMLSFFKYNNQSFIIFLQALIKFITRNKTYIWKKEAEQNYSPRKVIKNTSDIKRKDHSNNFAEMSANLNFIEPDRKEDPKINI